MESSYCKNHESFWMLKSFSSLQKQHTHTLAQGERTLFSNTDKSEMLILGYRNLTYQTLFQLQWQHTSPKGPCQKHSHYLWSRFSLTNIQSEGNIQKTIFSLTSDMQGLAFSQSSWGFLGMAQSSDRRKSLELKKGKWMTKFFLERTLRVNLGLTCLAVLLL